MAQKNLDQYKVNLDSKPKGKINVGYEALTGNDAPSNLRNKQKEATKRTGIDE